MIKILKETLGILVGNFILALAVALFLLPGDILSGGVSGISIILSPFIPIEESTMILILNIGLLLLGWLCLGFKFMVNSCVSSILYPVLLLIIQYFIEPVAVDPLLASIFGGLLGGVGVALVIRQGTSTGGMDIPPLIINKYFHFEISKAVMITDAITVMFGLFVYGLEAVLIGLISVYVSSIAISKVLTFGGSKAKYLQIISDKYEEINERINEVLERGSTIIDAKGGYTKENRKVLLVVVSDNEYSEVINIVEEYDRRAFVIVLDATDVHGEGFRDIVRI